jgi:hypothetical protein
VLAVLLAIALVVLTVKQYARSILRTVDRLVASIGRRTSLIAEVRAVGVLLVVTVVVSC